MIKKFLKTIIEVLRKSSVLGKNVNTLTRQTHAVSGYQIPLISRYICLSLVNFIYIAKTEPLKSKNGLKENTSQNDPATAQSLINQSDEFFSIGKFEESFKALEPLQDSDNVEVLWRISRALYNLSKQKKISKSDNASFINRAFDYIEKALKLEENNYAVHKWMAILFDAKSNLDGIKARINALPTFKKHLLRAFELNPKDATLVYMLGQYMYNIADMSRLQRIIAKTLFGTPPEATFEEAFVYFSKAEEIEPNFYSANLLMLGKTSLKLKKIEAARYWLKCAISYPVRTDEDENVRLEAEELLKKYPETKPKAEEKTPNIQ